MCSHLLLAMVIPSSSLQHKLPYDGFVRSEIGLRRQPGSRTHSCATALKHDYCNIGGLLKAIWGFPKLGYPEYYPPSTLIFLIGTPRKGTPISRNLKQVKKYKKNVRRPEPQALPMPKCRPGTHKVWGPFWGVEGFKGFGPPPHRSVGCRALCFLAKKNTA